MPSQGSKLRNWLVRFNLARPKDDDDEHNESDLRRIESTASQTSKRRRLYVNMKSSADSQDRIDEHSWVSNRVRTAKYTPLTFIPKNLFEQFRNVANLYFLFLVILQCIPLFGVTSPPLSAAPLIAILVITGIKDVFEDWKRNQSDRRVNTSITLTLSHWDNVNVPELTQGRWHRVKIVIGLFTMLAGIENEYTNAYIQARLKQQHGGSTNVPTCVKFQKEQDLEQLQTRETRNMPNINVHPPTEEVPRYEYDNGNNVAIDKPPQSNGTAANLTPQGKRLMSTMRTRSGSFRAELSNIFKPKPRMPYRPGMIPHSVLHRTTTQDTGVTSNRHSMDMSSDCQSEQPAGHEPLNPDCRVKWKETMWQDIKAGDYVLMKNDEPVPADVIILSTSEPDGICYVETKNLDGETNLKMRRALQATGEIQSVHDCERASFYFESEPPHANLYQYNGVLRWQVSNNTDEDGSDDYASVSHQKTEAVTYSNILLRGCVLRNTKWVIGIVMFTGNETKIMLNTGKTPSKRSKMAKATNPHVSFLFILLCKHFPLYRMT
jgi:phospholipid-translocating ATPase